MEDYGMPDRVIFSGKITELPPRILTTFNYRTHSLGQLNDLETLYDYRFPDETAKRSFFLLSVNLLCWLKFERMNPKLYDADYFPSMDDSDLKPVYLPENNYVIHLVAYSVSPELLEQLYYAKSDFIGRFVEIDGCHTLLVHPSLRDDVLFQRLGCTLSSRKFYFLPAASPRTGLTWELGREQDAFFTKLSFRGQNPQPNPKSDLSFPGSEEGKTSVYKSSTILALDHPSKSSFLTDEFYTQLKPEVISLTGHSYGVLFRKIPKSQLTDGTIIPFFSLAYTPVDGSKPLLVKFIEDSGLSIERYFESYFYDSVIRFIIANSLTGIYADHLHGQNLLIKLLLNTSSYPDKIKFTSLSPEVFYRDTNDLKIFIESEMPEYTTFRKKIAAPESKATPGSYLYLAATDFIKRSIVPILMALERWQLRGFLSDRTRVNFSSYSHFILPFYTKIINLQELSINQPGSTTANYDYNTLGEFTAFLLQEIRMTQGSRRERQWMKEAGEIAKTAIANAKITPVIDMARYERLREYSELFQQVYDQRTSDLDRPRVC
ncbi:MAG: hypothetical protein KBD64_07860 [Gammaproteobacteria bacterium]|nr:hypothetical protein [Gammaproteobacteria bacterium]